MCLQVQLALTLISTAHEVFVVGKAAGVAVLAPEALWPDPPPGLLPAPPCPPDHAINSGLVLTYTAICEKGGEGGGTALSD